MTWKTRLIGLALILVLFPLLTATGFFVTMVPATFIAVRQREMVNTLKTATLSLRTLIDSRVQQLEVASYHPLFVQGSRRADIRADLQRIVQRSDMDVAIYFINLQGVMTKRLCHPLV